MLFITTGFDRMEITDTKQDNKLINKQNNKYNI